MRKIDLDPARAQSPPLREPRLSQKHLFQHPPHAPEHLFRFRLHQHAKERPGPYPILSNAIAPVLKGQLLDIGNIISVCSVIVSLLSTPPFSSEEDKSVEDSAYITSSRGKPSLSVRLVQSGSLINPTAEPDWSDSELSEVSDTPKPHKTPSPHGE